jgi:hypothetical protein
MTLLLRLYPPERPFSHPIRHIAPTPPVQQTPPIRSPQFTPSAQLTLSARSTSPSPSSSSSLDPDQPVNRRSIMPSQSRDASVEQDSPSKVPLLLPRDISPAIMHKYEYACLGYFDTKDIVPEKQVRKILAGLWDTCVQDWVSINCE